MKLFKPIGFGSLLWVLIFFEVSILMFGFGLTGEESFYYPLHYFFVIIFIAILGLIYFKKEKGSFGKGLLVGLIMLITGVILDSAITVPLWIIPQGGSYSEFLFSPLLLLGEAISVLTMGVVGWTKR